MVKKMYIVGILIALFMLCATVSAIEDVSAAKYKKIDGGKKDIYGDKSYYSIWTTTFNGKVVKVSWQLTMQDEDTGKYVVYKKAVITQKKYKTGFKTTVFRQKTKYQSKGKSTYTNTRPKSKKIVNFYKNSLKTKLKDGSIGYY